MRKAAIKRAIRMKTAPPIMPPSSGVVSPLVGVLDGCIFAMGVAAGVILGLTSSGVLVGCPSTV